MKKEKQMQEMYERLLDYQQEEHSRNQRRIRIGIKLLWLIPLFFLVLLFITGSNKIIFLVLWIISVFALAIYLVAIEYKDYRTQTAVNRIRGEEDAAIEGLLHPEEAHEQFLSQLNETRKNIEAHVEDLKL